MIRVKRIVTVLAFIFLLSFPTLILAENWLYIGTTAHGMKWYVDADTAYRDDIYAKVWIRTIDIDGNILDSLSYIYKADQTIQDKYFISRKPNGEIIDQWSVQNQPYTKIPPTSVPYILYSITWPK